MKSLIPWKNSERSAAPARWGDSWFDRAWEDPFRVALSPFEGMRLPKMPSVDVTESDREVKVRAEIPGMNEKDIDLTWQDGVLRIRGEKKSEKEEKRKDGMYRECSYGSFSRDISLGESVEWKNAKASYRHGVLTVTLPKTENAKKAITIKVN